MCTFGIVVPFVAFCWFFGFGFCFVWARVCVFSGLLVFLPIAFLVCRFGLVFVVRNGYKKDCFIFPG